MDRAHAQALDAADPLAPFRDRFELPEGIIYLDGNSLGALPKATAPKLDDLIRREWGRDLITSWNRAGWIEAPERIGGKIARLVGAGAHEVAVADSPGGGGVDQVDVAAHEFCERPLVARVGVPAQHSPLVPDARVHRSSNVRRANLVTRQKRDFAQVRRDRCVR